ncbi:hypothetical protein [Mycobacterium kyorinense]|uniref:hypothetical protein n=1 Tax=Mycobacterium kyorinense TaxID=487514 RepID=UPI0012E7DCF5|nr:hypothetical protein [Mycobacterium kyorinense]
MIVVTATGAYIFTQYHSAQKPSPLANFPEYPYARYHMKGSACPINNLTSQERAHAETTLRQFAANVEPGYRPTSERFLAGKGPFAWDAIRSVVSGYLSDGNFQIESVGQTPEEGVDFAYIVWERANSLQRMFNNNRILAVALQNPIRPAPTDEQVHVCAYFELTATS